MIVDRDVFTKATNDQVHEIHDLIARVYGEDSEYRISVTQLHALGRLSTERAESMIANLRAAIPTPEDETFVLGDRTRSRVRGDREGQGRASPTRAHTMILVGDATEQLRSLPTGSVQTCITSPPYYGLRDYGVDGQIGLEETPHEYVSKLVKVFREVKRVLADDGTLWLVIGDSYAATGKSGGGDQGKRWKHSGADYTGPRGGKWSPAPEGFKSKDLLGIPWRVAFALQADGWYLRSDIIWSKPNPMPESVKDRPTRAHEYVFLLSRQERYYYDHEAIKEPAVSNKRAWTDGGSEKQSGHGRRHAGFNSRYVERIAREGSPKTRNRRSVWTIATRAFKGAHFAVFPEQLVEPMILAGSAEGDTVLDPFAGSGTVGVVAQRHGRKFIGIELNPEYVTLAEQRLEKIA